MFVAVYCVNRFGFSVLLPFWLLGVTECVFWILALLQFSLFLFDFLFLGWLVRAFGFCWLILDFFLSGILAWFALNLATFWSRVWNCRQWVSSLGRSFQHVGTCVFAVLLWGQDHASRSKDTENCLLIYSLSPLLVSYPITHFFLQKIGTSNLIKLFCSPPLQLL